MLAKRLTVSFDLNSKDVRVQERIIASPPFSDLFIYQYLRPAFVTVVRADLVTVLGPGILHFQALARLLSKIFPVKISDPPPVRHRLQRSPTAYKHFIGNMKDDIGRPGGTAQ